MCLGIPAKLDSIDETADDFFRTGKISFGGISRTVSLAMLTDAKPGDYVLVHAGVALSVITEQEAATVFEYLKMSGELDEEGLPDT
ncbi:HypC/HybG/HupF family hydrogenase formation chaperone [Pontibacter anaerobius]|uniref:HypC/HybG/HupF family hydrogenase formation chaperone n=1 Tax=Pontibacter anaerobius TaxID=2993940 RepID=A0ABT3REE7_9BACT|nr:HypC/HybG/HupF family hydrogenase formation chaperone [Pontibacter anaerobius]MCX2739732.1 HypC/HybG/HupF family hydrogenase formation chaperone [Pontibacter anaerobius]